MSTEPDLGLGRFNVRWFAVAALLGLLVAFGIAGNAQQREHGDIVTGLRTIGQGGAAWGLYIVFDMFFVGLACGGMTFTILVRLFHLRDLRPLSRMAQILTLVSLAMAGLCVISDLGRPLHGLVNLPRYARTMSPFFGTFSLIACTGSLATFVYLWLDGRADAALCAERGGPLAWFHRIWAFGWKGTQRERWRHRQTSFWLSLGLLPLLVVAYSTLGLVFGIQGGRPGWFSPLRAPSLLVLAAISSLGMLAVIAAIARRTLRLESQIRIEVFLWIGNALWMCAVLCLYLLCVEELTASYASSTSETRVAEAVVLGPYAPLFWTMLLSFVVPTALLFRQFLRRSVSVPVTVTCALVLCVAVVLKHILLVVPSQTHGMLIPAPVGAYRPTWVEFALIVGVLSLGTLTYLVLAKVFPIIPLDVVHVEKPARAERERGLRRGLRVAFLLTMLLVGTGVATAGFLLCARVGNVPWQDPPIPLSPLIFVAGLVLVFYSAAVYEVLPESRKGTGGPA